jgi:hypothetical protein
MMWSSPMCLLLGRPLSASTFSATTVRSAEYYCVHLLSYSLVRHRDFICRLGTASLFSKDTLFETSERKDGLIAARLNLL